LRAVFEEMTPIFKNATIKFEDIGPFMQNYMERNNISKNPRRSLIGSYKGDGILLASPLLSWYLNHGLVVTDIQLIIEYEPAACFRNFGDQVSTARRQGDFNPDHAILAETFKLQGNSSYGKTLENKKRHRDLKYCDETKADELINSPLFSSISHLNENVFEIESFKKKIPLDLPIQIGLWVYNMAKLKMLQFAYDLLKNYINPADYEYCEMDTDSAYLALSGVELEDLIITEKREEFFENQHKWFPIPVCNEHRAAYIQCKIERKPWNPRPCCQARMKFDRRTPGLFKLEFKGEGIISLCSKTYYCFGEAAAKLSCKGISKRHNTFQKTDFMDVLKNQASGRGINVGFRVHNHQVLTYEQTRYGLSYFYAKREVLSDGVSTRPLEI
jgi:hypothetical protein